MTPVFRFAPSPNGHLHLGHAYSALLNADLAREAGGRVLLRLEDLDRERCRPEFAAAILADCRWLGIPFEEPVRRQSEHLPEYAAALARLRAMGVAYPAFMSRGEIADRVHAGEPWPRDPDGSPHYPPDDRMIPRADAEARIAAGEPHAIRLDMAEAFAQTGPLHWREAGKDGRIAEVAADPLAWGDVLLAGREIAASYHLAVVVDDAAQGVTNIVRGEDLFAATAVHRVLQTLLGLPAPFYRHHRLVRDARGRKLAKSDADTGIAALRQAGMTAADVRRIVGL